MIWRNLLSGNPKLIIIYYAINIALSLLYIPLAIQSIISISRIYIDLAFPLTIHMDIAILIKGLLVVSVFLYFIGLIMAKTDLIIISVFITHVIYSVFLANTISTYFGPGTYGIGLQMLFLSIAYLILNNLLLRGRVKRAEVQIIKKNIVIESLNLALLLISPVILALFFLVMGIRIFDVLAELINRLPEPINRIAYIYLFNPYSQLFTLLAILGVIIWLLRNLVEPIILYLRLGIDVARQTIYSEFNSMKRHFERKYFKASIGALPPYPSIKYWLITVIIIVLLPLFLIIYLMGPDSFLSLTMKSINFIISHPYPSKEHLVNAPKTGIEVAINNFIEIIFLKFRNGLIWLERILRFLLWWIWA